MVEKNANARRPRVSLGVTRGGRQYFRCNPCNAFRKRLSGVLRNVEPELAHSFRSFSAEEKQKFRDANMSKFSKDLPLALQNFVEEAPASNQKMVW